MARRSSAAISTTPCSQGWVASLRQPAGESDVGAAGQQGRGRLERDDTIVQYKFRPGLTDDALAPGEGADLEIDRRRNVCGDHLSDVIGDYL